MGDRCYGSPKSLDGFIPKRSPYFFPPCNGIIKLCNFLPFLRQTLLFHVLNTLPPCCDGARGCCTPCYHDYISATPASTWPTFLFSPRRAAEARSLPFIIYVTVTWLSAAHATCPGACFHCANTCSSRQGQAAAPSDMTKRRAVRESDPTQLLDS